jgi:hypothetical protein
MLKKLHTRDNGLSLLHFIMNNLLLTCCFSVFFTSARLAYAQDKHDFTWILGYGGPSNPVFFIGGNHIDFNSGNPAIDYFYLENDMDSPMIMSDSTGRLQFYTNGCAVFDKNHQLMENGDELNSGLSHDYWCDENGIGYLSYLGSLGLPVPGYPGKYILFHSRLYEPHDSIDVLYTLVDMTANGGVGRVTEKNRMLQYGRLSRTFQAVRHGNGRDWWVVVPQENADMYHFYLLDPAGIHGPLTQQVSAGWIAGQSYNLMCAFSPDGNKFARLGSGSPAAFRLYDFDRCSGKLSNPVTITTPDTSLYAACVCFSPNSRFLYLTNDGMRLYQFDTESADPESSVQLIGVYDGFLSVYNLPTGLHHMALAPDNRIYMACTNGVNLLHTIHQPDQAGAACDFRQHDVLLPAHNTFFLPNNAFYRLYRAAGSPCDTLGLTPPVVAFWRSGQDTASGPLAVSFTDLSYYRPVSWHWDFGDGVADTAQFPVHVFPAPGAYEVCLMVCNEAGVCDTLCREVLLTAVGPNLPAPGHILPARVYPNPAAGQVWVSHQAGARVLFSLHAVSGQQVVRQILSPQSGVEAVDISALPAGLYFWQLSEMGRVLGTGKLIVQKE